MDSFQILYSALVSCIFGFLVISLIRTRILRVNYAILWIAVCIVLLLFIIKYRWIVWLDAYLNLGGPKNLFFFVTIFFLLLLCIQFSLIISSLVIKNKNLAQKIALLEQQLLDMSRSNESTS